jgi:adenine-specific DNA-methyltransferase
MENLTNINYWKKNFGVLPILLNPLSNDDKYLMLNGGSADFCLQTNSQYEDTNDFYGISWSSNTKNYISLDNENVIINNWIDQKTEKIPFSKVEAKADVFYNYLVSKSFKTENDVVPFIINIFRKLRNVTSEKENPTVALNLLFKLLISIEENYTNIDFTKWELQNVDIPSQFEYFAGELKTGFKSISPNLDLILRHSAGALFQEAQKEVLFFNSQRDLFGGVSNKIVTNNEAYSSIHYTPQYLARTIVENSLKLLEVKTSLKIFDPACGSSEFLIEALKQLKNNGYNGKITIVGWDSSESAINTSKFLLHYENRTQWNNELDLDIKLVNDSLMEVWVNDFDLILMNPPFISWERLEKRESKDAVLEALGTINKIAKPNQAIAFFYKAIQSLNSEGIIGCVLPSSIFTFNSYSKIRKDIEEQINIIIAAKLGNFVFEDALTDVSFFIGKKPKTNDYTKLIWCKNEKGNAQEALRKLRKMDVNNQQTVDSKNISIYTPIEFPILKENWKIISLEEDKFYKNLNRLILSKKIAILSDIFTVKQGVRLGSKVFLISKEDFEKIPEIEKKYYKKAIVNDSIKNGQLNLTNYVWYPYNNEGIVINNETEFQDKAPFSYNILLPFKKELISRARKDINSWWHLSEHRAWLRKNEVRLYSTEFGKSNSFAIDKKGDFIVERGNGWIPKKSIVEYDFYFYLAFFSSTIFDKLLSIYSKQLAGGNWYDLGAKYTKDIPIPNIYLPEIKDSEAYLKLVQLGKELEKGNSFVKNNIDEILSTFFYS